MDQIYFEQMADPVYGNIIRWLVRKRLPANATEEHKNQIKSESE
jgi:hypothetical protein